MSHKLTVAAVQMPITKNVGRNLRVMAAAIGRLAHRKVRLAVFPECCLSGYLVPAKDRNWPAIHAGIARLQQLARANRMALVFGTAFRSGKRLPYNSVLAVDERGRMVSRYDKCHLIGGDHDCFRPGTRLPEVFALAGARVAMQICFDVRFPEPARLAALSGAQLVTYSFAGFGKGGWKLPVMEGHLRSRAAENGVFVAAANAAHRVLIAASRILGPDGLDLAAARPGRAGEIVAATAPPEAHHKFLHDRRPDLYSLRSNG